MNSRQTDSQRRRDKGPLRFFALRVVQRARLHKSERVSCLDGSNTRHVVPGMIVWAQHAMPRFGRWAVL